MVVNAIAVVWGVAMIINLVWPRAEVYNPVAPFHWYLQWSGVLVPVLLTVGGLVLYRVRIRHRTWILAEHAAVTTTASGGPLSPAPGGTDPSRPSDDPNLAVPDLTAPAERA